MPSAAVVSPPEDVGSARRAYELIRAAIVEGRYRAGQRLIEQRIGEEFSLSRTPVREALRMLEAEGLVQSQRNRGAVVRPLSAKDVVDLYQLRARLESLAAERAAERVAPESVEELDRAIDEFDQAIIGDVDIPGVRRLNQANARFHGTILEMADHARLSALLSRTVDVPLVFQAFRVFNTQERVRSNMFHRLIRNAIVAGDGQRAGALMSEHILMGRDSLLAAMAEAPVEALYEGIGPVPKS